MNMQRMRELSTLRVAAAVLLLTLTACQQSTSPPRVTAPPASTAARAPAPTVPVPSAPPSAKASAKAPVVLPSMDLPSGPIYTCDVGGTRKAIEYAENVERLCRRHPEMGPCQYERDACRKSGGRVFTAKGDEVTAAVEAAYDEKVRRVRFQGDGAPAKR